jgi:transcription elongation factor Elf1
VYSEWIDACEAVATTTKAADDNFVVKDQEEDGEDAEVEALSDLDEAEFA